MNRLLLSLLFIISSTAYADLSDLSDLSKMYFGIDAGYNLSQIYDGSTSPAISNSSTQDCSKSPTQNTPALELTAGYKLNKTFSFEAAYINHGEYKFNQCLSGSTNVDYSRTLKATGLSIAGYAYYPLQNSLSIFGRLGMNNWNLTESSRLVDDDNTPNNFNNSLNISEIQPSIGAGIQLLFGNQKRYELRANWQYTRYSNIFNDTSNSVNTFSLGFLYHLSKARPAVFSQARSEPIVDEPKTKLTENTPLETPSIKVTTPEPIAAANFNALETKEIKVTPETQSKQKLKKTSAPEIPVSPIVENTAQISAVNNTDFSNRAMESSRIEINIAPREMPLKNLILPIIQPMDSRNSTAQEEAASNLLWNDVNAYNAFDESSPLLLPGTALINTLTNTGKIDQSRDNTSMYESAEQSARLNNAGVAVWGNAMEFADTLYIETHLSLIDEPLNLHVRFDDFKNLDLTLSIPRTRFAFALKALTEDDTSTRKLVAIKNGITREEDSSTSNAISNIKSGDTLYSGKTKNDWFKLTGDNGEWVNANDVAVVPESVYLKKTEFEAYEDTNSSTPVILTHDSKAVRVLDVKLKKDATWLKLDLSPDKKWVNSQHLIPRPKLAMTEFLVGLQYFQKQAFSSATRSLQRFIMRADETEENNVSLSTAYQMLTLSYIQNKDWTNANKTIDKTTALTKYDPEIYNLKAITLLGEQLDSGEPVRLKEIVENIAFALYLEPEDVTANRILSSLTSLAKKTSTEPSNILADNQIIYLDKLLKHHSFAELD